MNGRIDGCDLMQAEEMLLDIARMAKKTNAEEVTTLRNSVAFINEKLKCLDSIAQRNETR